MDLRIDERYEPLIARTKVLLSTGEPLPATGSVTELAIVARELGRAAVPSRFHTDVLSRLLGWIADDPAAVALGARADGTGLVADGVRDLAGSVAVLVVVGISAPVALPVDAVTAVAQPAMDDPDAVQIRVESTERSIALDGGASDVEAASARAAVVRCADALGAAEGALAATVERVNGRVVFGAALANQQVVQHRCAEMLIDVSVARDAVFDAAGIIDRSTDRTEVLLAASYAKASAIERCRRVTAVAHQLAGGQGISAASPLHRWYRRVKGAEPVLGDARSHRARIAAHVLEQAPGTRVWPIGGRC